MKTAVVIHSWMDKSEKISAAAETISQNRNEKGCQKLKKKRKDSAKCLFD